MYVCVFCLHAPLPQVVTAFCDMLHDNVVEMRTDRRQQFASNRDRSSFAVHAPMTDVERDATTVDAALVAAAAASAAVHGAGSAAASHSSTQVEVGVALRVIYLLHRVSWQREGWVRFASMLLCCRQ